MGPDTPVTRSFPALRWIIASLVLLACILVPFVLFEARIEAWTGSTLAFVDGHPALAYTIIVALLAGDVVLPVPSSLVSVAAGALLGFWGGFTAIWLGLSIGCLVGYALGRGGGRPALRRIVGADELERAARLYAGRGSAALVLARGVPVLAEASVIGAGAARMPFMRFVLLTSIANLAVAAAYAIVGALALSSGSFFLFFFGLTALPALSWLVWSRSPA